MKKCLARIWTTGLSHTPVMRTKAFVAGSDEDAVEALARAISREIGGLCGTRSKGGDWTRCQSQPASLGS